MIETVWVYIKSEPNLYTVGFYSPRGEWHTDSDHESREAAAARVHYLNGGKLDEHRARMPQNGNDYEDQGQ